MKKINALLLALLIAATVACKKKEDDTTDPVTESGIVELSGDLSSQTLDASKKYLLVNTVYVRSGNTLTIPAGTVIFGDKATKGTLVIDKGGKIMAIGTAANPIVFTSEAAPGERDRGDWGGLLILGNAFVNSALNNDDGRPAVEGISPVIRYGRNDNTLNTENSGTLQYVRIEFAGIALFPNQETNGLTLAGVGSGTTIDHVQVSYGGDDAFEWFGGTVNANYLVAHANWDDDMDCDNGYQGKVQYALVVRDQTAADQSKSNGFEVDNNAGGTETGTGTITAPHFSNVTFYGPKAVANTSVSGSYGSALHLRRQNQISIINSVFTGYSGADNSGTYGLLIEGSATTPTLKNNVFAFTKIGSTDPFFVKAQSSGVVPANFSTENVMDTILATSEWATVGMNSTNFMAITYPYPANPNFAVTSGYITSGASFTGFTFPESPAYRGAFGATDWTDSWTTFDPINTGY